MTTIMLNDKEYRVKYPIRSLMSLEKAMGKSFGEIFADISAGSVGFDLMVTVIWAGLIHENRGLTVDMVANWLEDADLFSAFSKCMEAFSESITAFLPKSENAETAEAIEKND